MALSGGFRYSFSHAASSEIYREITLSGDTLDFRPVLL
jgi:hypothetical protein